MIEKRELFEQVKKRSVPLANIDELCFGQLLLTGLSNGVDYDFDGAVGFVCQVRKEADTNGGDVILLRHPDKSLICHLDQGFFVVPNDLAIAVIRFFERTPEHEMVDNPSLDYTIGEFLRDEGFFIEKKSVVSLD